MAEVKFLLIIVICSLIVIGATIAIAKATKMKGLKFIPSIVFALMAAGFFVKSLYFSQSFQDIAFMLMGIMAVILTVVSFITAVLAGKSKRKRDS